MSVRHFVDYVYSNYSRANKRSWARPIHRRLTTSRFVVRSLFGMRIEPEEYERSYFDLTTVLMHTFLRRLIERRPGQKILEIGAGRFALLSGALSRAATRTIDAVEIHKPFIMPAREAIAMNGLDVNVFHSDVFSTVPEGQYDLIFWNLPYYRNPARLLDPLFGSAPEYLSPNGEVVLGFNTSALRTRDVLGILERHGAIQLVETRTYRWNRHEILVCRRRS